MTQHGDRTNLGEAVRLCPDWRGANELPTRRHHPATIYNIGRVSCTQYDHIAPKALLPCYSARPSVRLRVVLLGATFGPACGWLGRAVVFGLQDQRRATGRVLRGHERSGRHFTTYRDV